MLIQRVSGLFVQIGFLFDPGLLLLAVRGARLFAGIGEEIGAENRRHGEKRGGKDNAVFDFHSELVPFGAAVAVVAKLKWLSMNDRAGALLGGVVGFAVAAPIAVTNLHTPLTPILICGLAGVGLLLGIGIARGWRGRS